mmetsp:Transcript_17834/g.19866  ORF Transcript_17834/g.19866 Transcript_17834/m.19866 type:complete len:122 (+) Transcript_17834:51-416(+)
MAQKESQMPPTPRVTGSTIQNYRNPPHNIVRLVGTVQKKAPGSVEILASDGVVVNVKLLGTDYSVGTVFELLVKVEPTGEVKECGAMPAYLEERGHKFDMKLYNDLTDLTQRYPEVFGLRS